MSPKYIYLLLLLDMVDLSLLMPLQNPLILSLGGNLFLIGLVHSLGAGAQLIGSPIIGSLSDLHGRKSLLLITLYITLMLNIFASLPSLAIYFTTRLLHGALHHTDLLLRTIVSDKYSKEEANTIFNNLGAAMGVAFIIGPLMGGLIFETFGKFYIVNIVCCALNVCVIALTHIHVEDSVAQDKAKIDAAKSESFFVGISKIFANLKNVDYSRYGYLLKARFLVEATFNFIFMNMGLILTEVYGFSMVHIGLFVSCISIMMVLGNVCTPYVRKTFYSSDLMGSSRLFHGFFTCLAILPMLPFTDTAVFYVSVILSLCLVKVLIDSAIMEGINAKTTDSDKGAVMGANTSMLSLSGLICPLISGIAGSMFEGKTVLLVLPIIPAAAGCVIMAKTKRFEDENIKKEN